MTTKYVPGLDLLRFFAAVLVASLHLWGSPAAGGGFVDYAASLLGTSNLLIDQRHLPIAFTGALGVQIFFTISGFVIAYSAYACRGPFDFVLQRFLRLAPTLWICTFVSLAIALATGFYEPDDALARLARSLVLSPIGAHVDDVVWTLVLEIVFYGLVSILLLTDRIDRLGTLAAILALVSLLYWSIYFLSGCSSGSVNSACAIVLQPIVQKASSILLVQHGCFFAVGVTSWRIWARRAVHLNELFQYGLAVPACLLQLTWFSQYFFIHYGEYGAPRGPALAISVWSIAMAAFAFSCWKNEVLSAIFSRVKMLPVVRLIGLATYPLYLTHVFVGGLVTGIFAAMGLQPLLCAALGIAVATMLSAIIARWVEPQLRLAVKDLLLRTLRVKPA